MTSLLSHRGPAGAGQVPLSALLGRSLVCLLVCLLGACGGAPEAGARAKLHLLRGDLDAAEEALVGLEGEQVEQLLAQLASIRAEQASAGVACEDLLAQAGELTSEDLRAELRDLAHATRGRWGRQVVETEIARLDDIVASGEYSSLGNRVSSPVPPDETPGPVALAESLPQNWRVRDPSGPRVTEGSALSAEELAGLGATASATGATGESTDESQLVSEQGQRAVLASSNLGPEPTTAVGWEQRARMLDEAGELSGAAEALFSAAFLYEPGGLRDETLGLAQDYSDRAQFATELATAGHDVRVLEVDELLHHAGQLVLSMRAELGLVLELSARGEKTRAMQRMRELLGSRRVQAQSAWPLIARMREETAPETGYLWFRGDYVRPEQHAQILLEEELDRLAELLPRAEARERDELYERLFVNGRDAQLAVALEARWRQAARGLERSNSLDELEQLAAIRAELDERRAAALELIFDEVTYFYPYSVPEVSSDKAQEYPPVQRRVDDLVAEVESLWELPRQVALPASIHAALGEFAWCRVRFDELELALPSLASEPDGEELPAWVAGLPALEIVSLREFAWSAEEAATLARSREVVQLNEAQWRRDWDADENQQRAMSHDQEQVRITNAYRTMLGRRAVAWNPRIQAAARDHSEWMSQTGEFGHFEPGRPESYGPGDRMRLRGYAGGASENVAATGGSPLSAHQGWCRSSGHHRNLLMSGHKEMASSGVGRLWTQNFGMGRSFEEELERLREDQEE